MSLRLWPFPNSRALSGHCQRAEPFACSLSGLSHAPLLVCPGHSTLRYLAPGNARIETDVQSTQPASQHRDSSLNSIHPSLPPRDLANRRPPRHPVIEPFSPGSICPAGDEIAGERQREQPVGVPSHLPSPDRKPCAPSINTQHD